MSDDYSEHIDYEHNPLEVYPEQVWEVVDPWTAQLRGILYSEADADLFCQAVYRQWRKKRKKAGK